MHTQLVKTTRKTPFRFLPLFIALLVSAAMELQVWHFASHAAPDGRGWAPPGWQTLEKLELWLLDRRFVARGNLTPPSRDRIAIVSINHDSFDSGKMWPWPRGWHAQLVNRLHKAGARVIGIDIDFADYQGGKRGALSRDDQELVHAIKSAKNVVLPSGLEPIYDDVGNAGDSRNVGDAGDAGDARDVRDAGDVRTPHPSSNAISTPIDELDVLTPDMAVSGVPLDEDDAARRYLFYLGIGPESEPFGGFAPLCVALDQGLARSDDLTRYNAMLRSGVWRDTQGNAHTLPLTENTLPGDQRSADKMRSWTMPLWFWGAPRTFSTYSYDDVRTRWSDARCEQAFKGRIVLVGARARILKDIFPLPEFPSRDGAAVSNEISGVEIQATMIAMLLDGQFLYEQSLPVALVITLFSTLGGSLWILVLSGPIPRWARRASAWGTRRGFKIRIYDGVWLGLYTLASLLPVALFWGVCQWAFSVYHLWIWATFPMLGALGASVVTILPLFGTEIAERRKPHTRMARIVDPDVMKEILAHPEAQYPRSRRVETSVLFTDLEDFTSFADAHEPEEVVEALNAFLDRMPPIISAHGGCIDKYIGDSIMAFFGAPIPRADHAAQALRCAIALQDECARFRQETGLPFLMRIGVHTGMVQIGSVGSQLQFNYTIIGDTVNLASRLEKKNKEFGSRILCSAQTHEAAPGVAGVERAQTAIRGKEGEIEVFVVRGPLEDAPHDTLWNQLA